MKNKKKSDITETLEFAVYGGICGILGLLSIILLFTAVLECRPGIPNAIGRSIITTALAIMTIHFGKRSPTKQGASVIILGIVILILVHLFYIFGWRK